MGGVNGCILFFGRKSYIVINVIFVDSRMIDFTSKSPKGIEMNVKLLSVSYDKKEFLTKYFVFEIEKTFVVNL